MREDRDRQICSGTSYARSFILMQGQLVSSGHGMKVKTFGRRTGKTVQEAENDM